MSKILVVEDSQAQREMIVGLLKRNQFEVSTASNGLDAIAQVQSIHPDLIVMDIIMPGMHGYELCRKLRDNPDTWNISIVMCSSKSMESDRHWGLRQGANAYISKPFAVEELVDTVNELLKNK